MVTAKSLGFVSKRLGFPRLLGEIIGGIIIGSSVLGLVSQTEFISNLAEIGVILIMFLAGLETDLEELKKSAKKSSLIAIGGIVIPFIMGFGLIYVLRTALDIREAIFLGVIMTATSMGITVSTLKDLKELKSEFGMSILGAAVIDDIVGVIILAIALGSFGQATTSVETLILQILLFLVSIIVIGKLISATILKNRKFFEKVKPKHILSVSLITVFMFSVFASDFGMAAIIGAYSIGTIISTTTLKEKVINQVDQFGVALFIPVFFVNIGLMLDVDVISKYFGITLLVAFTGITSKLIGSYIGARVSGFDNRQSFRVGISMAPRAEVTLIISNLALKLGFIGEDIFAGVILLVLVSTVFTPWVLRKTKSEKSEK